MVIKKLVSSIAAACACLFAVGAEQVQGAANAASPAPLKVLMIGNSFSISCTRQLPQVAEANGHKLDLASLYIGGCSLERHWQNVEAAATNATFKPYRFDRYVEGKRVVEKGKANIPDVLVMDKWDVVTVQQCSHKSWDKASYHPWGDNLVAKIRELAPQTKILVQETWSYPPWDRRLKNFGFDQVEMYARLHDAYREFAGKYGFGIIPVGTAAEICADRNSLFTKPDFHFNHEEGEYLQALVWDASLFGPKASRPCAYRPEGMSAERAEELDAAAHLAFERESVKSACADRVFRDARPTRGNTNILKLQPIDDASWLWMPGAAAKAGGKTDFWEGERTGKPVEGEVTFLKFRNEFDVAEGDGTLVLDVSADERFYLTLDGMFLARGPNRATVENWQYQTYVATGLEPGRHVVEAVVWTLGDFGPLAQLSHRGGFVLKANGAYDAKLTTGKGLWKVGRLPGIKPIGKDKDAGAWGTGSQFEIVGSGPYSGEPVEWAKPEVVRGGAGDKGPRIYGGRTGGWMLFPSQLPDQTDQAEYKMCPGSVKAVAKGVEFRSRHVFTEDEAKDTIDLSKPFTVPANTKMQIAWDMADYYCVYPEVRLSGGKGAKFAICFAEAAKRGDNHLKTSEPDARGKIVGRFLPAFGDTFVSDGRRGAVFSSPWFRCGKWVRIDIETKDEPLAVDLIRLVESRYPLEMQSAFTTPDDPSLEGIRRICARAMQMCCHEMLFDCPYYEQQMYPGDTRVQLNVLSAMSRDDRMIKRAIELYDLGTRDDGMCPFNWPTRGLQEGGSYTLCYLLMYGDYTMNHADREWLRARLPGLRKSMAGMEYYENKEGLLENLPGWNFMDWVVGWDGDGTAPGCRFGDGVNAELNLYWNLAMKSAATTERALGNDLQAKYWEAKSKKLAAKIVEKFWSEERGLLADTPGKKNFSEHAQCLALIGDVLPKDKAEAAFRHLVEDEDLKRCTVYFSHYLFETYFKFGRGDLFLKRLDLWRDYVKKGLATTQESPDSGKNGQNESRSDCHAWGAHPIWFMQTGLAGIKSDAPFFEKVRIAPCPGGLKELKATHPHPKGWIKVDLNFVNGKAYGTVETPVPGVFTFGGEVLELKKGLNRLGRPLDDVPWIGDGQPERNGADWYDEDPAPEFVAEFVLPEGMKATKAHFACAGFGGFVFNGTPSRDISGLETVWSVYDKTVYSMSRNVKVASKKDPFDMWLLPYPATNTVHVRLGNGFYNLPPLRFWGAKCFRETLAHGRPCFKFSIDGLDKPLEWKWRKTNVLRNSVYLGVEVDASRPSDKEWKPAAVVAGPNGKIIQWNYWMVPPTTVRTSAHSIGKAHWLKEGEVQIVDFGRNASAIPVFYFFDEAPGTRIEIVYGERLNADGSVNPLTQTAGQIKSPGMGGPGAPDLACQRDVFVCGGRHEPPIVWDTFEPQFTWHVFRYAEVRGAKNLLVPGRAFRSIVSTLRNPKQFKADDPKLDALHDVCVRTFLSNVIGGVQSDCPGRERLGYGGDIVATYEAYMMNWDMREIYLKILRDFADEAEDDGWITETAPYVGIADRGFGGRSGPISWSLAVPELIDGILRHYNDKRALDFYPVCARYVRLVAEKCPDGIVPNCIGDHEALERAPDGCTATAHWHRFVELTAKFAKMLGRDDDEKEFTALAEKIRAAFVAKYVKDGIVANGTQSAQSIGLYLGLVPADQVAAAEKRLVEAVEEKDCGPTTGIFSTRYMLMYLSEHGRVDLARKIVLHKGFPGWLHMIDNGATTLWETWKESDNVYSNCHPMFGSVDEWILKYARGE